MITEAQKQQLTPQQLLIAQKWDKENAEYTQLMEQLSSIEDEDQTEVIVKQLINLTPEICEHNRSVEISCEECDEIEMVLYPDLFDANGVRHEIMESTDQFLEIEDEPDTFFS